VTVALQPATQVVAPGADFDLLLEVTAAGSPFNAFDAIVGFDPAALTPVVLAPLSLQEGALMTGACGTRFHDFRAGAARDTLTDVLLCANVSVTGPGTIYRLRFHASSTEQSTTVHLLPGLRFFDSGILIPSSGSDAVVTIANTVGVSGPRGEGMQLALAPNPARGPVSIRIDGAPAGTQELRVIDARGRRVRVIESGWLPAGARLRTWDGASQAGGRVPAGSYWIELRAGGRSVRARCVLF
jgi:hypothetical protein